MRWIAALALCLLVARGARADWAPTRDPFDPAIVNRYKAMLAHEPHDEMAFRRLVELYQRYRTVAKLAGEYEAKLAQGDDWATLVVLARLPRPRSEAVALWKRALAANPNDGLGWLAAGDAFASDPAAARDAYRKAAALVPPAKKRAALMKLVAAAGLVNDPAGVDDAYEQLIALAPKDGELWLERGRAQLVAKQYARAETTFAAAIPLLATDPERRLSAHTSHALALEGLGRVDEALAEWEHELDTVPAGYLVQELVDHIVTAERRRLQLADAIARFEKRWPERSRGYFEWATLADLYKETGAKERAIDAYRRAVGKASTEVQTQRKLIALLDELHPDQALAQHEAAARLAPGDADLQIALAKRYHATADARAFVVLEALVRRMARNVNVLQAIAGLYEQWDEMPRAIAVEEAIVLAEPNEPDHAIVLGEAYWRTDKPDKAHVAWARLEKIHTGAALLRYGDVLALHEEWADAVSAYTKSIELDPTTVDAWYGRAHAHEGLSHWGLAVADARRAVALTSYASAEDGFRNRQLLVRVLARSYAAGDHQLEATVAEWRFAFDHGDPSAGYLLAAHHQRLGDYQLHGTLLQLRALVPDDDSLAIVMSRSFVRRREFARAKQELAAVARHTPARADEMKKLTAEVDHDEERAERAIRWEEEGRAPIPGVADPDLVSREKLGLRLGLGADVRDTSGALYDIGVYYSSKLAPGTALVWDFDFMQRDDQMAELDLVAFDLGVARQIVDAHRFELAAFAAPRVELRYGREGQGSRWDRFALAGDLGLEVLPRAFPAVLGVRFEQSFTDAQRASSVLVELGVEFR